MKILHIQASPRGGSSNSIALTDAFVEACRAMVPSIMVDTLNVWTENLPEFDQEAIGAKYKAIAHADMTGKEEEVWDRIKLLIERFQSADRIVLGTPMWNFGIPYKLKQLIDLVNQRNFLFTYDGKEYGPALRIEKGLTVYTQGSLFREGTALPPSRFDYQTTYLGFMLDLIGVQSLRSVVVDNAWNQNADESARSVADGKARVLQLVEWFLA